MPLHTGTLGGRLSLRRNFSWMSVGQTVNALGQWALLAVLAKLMDVLAVGEFSLALAISTPIIAFTNLGLNQVLATDVRHQHRFGHYLGLRLLTGLVGFLAIALVTLILGYGVEAATVIVLVGLTKAIVAQSEILYGLFQACERMDYAARSLILRALLSVALFGLCVFLTGTLVIGVVGLLVAALIVFIFVDLASARKAARTRAEMHSGQEAEDRLEGLRPLWNPKILSRLAWQALPLGLVAMLASLQLNLPRYVIADQFGMDQLGYFAAMIYILSAGNQLANALGLSASARLARLYMNGERRLFLLLLARMVGVGVFLGAVGIVAAYAAGADILTILYAAEYAEYADVFVLIMAAALIRYVATMLEFGVLASRRFILPFVNHAFVTLVSLVGSLYLIQQYGIVGAAYVTILAMIAYLIGVLIINGWLVARIPVHQPE